MKIGIIGAMNEEVVELKAVMSDIKSEKIGNLEFFNGKLLGKDVVLVEGGIGKVNAAICATLIINHFKVDKVLFTGVAGGVNPNINIGDIVIGNDLIEHDFDSTAFGYELGQIPRMDTYIFKADQNLVDIACNVAEKEFGKYRVCVGRIVSGDEFVASIERIKWLRDTFEADCTEMEGAAVAHVCHIFNMPFLIIRAISDKANHDAKVDFPEFVKLAAKNSKTIIEGILNRL
ncbi:5'-methylthioadenosine/adenosylhomocysteine nucleosidase [uncultured Fusobacterium sp.]|uniref:5'-methylthioadenosine/adenosylhomocysteine nucleosidase n=1 Tax=uncultured Fusobacterium sp. TaxID=159267 RepID=UPI000BBADDFF|nr:5'-methylthioadenosine/adenosylhomocysteine nucleosidase [uncultured Fusobacterium sp.]BBA51065.1 5'-methylthioadenosine/S-adenosylhomocysteine nucleosidase [Fusobacterium varium]